MFSTNFSKVKLRKIRILKSQDGDEDGGHVVK